jgi:hypothetical protein
MHGDTPPTRKVAPVARRVPDGYECPDFDAALWWAASRHVGAADKLSVWADKLGLPVGAIDFMGAATIAGLLSFPMYDGHGAICGIRTRTQAGEKLAVKGSKAGVFLPTVHMPDLDPLICEGPTDAAAALALGFEPIGRPSCSGCERHVGDVCRGHGYSRVTICADSDGPGIQGAQRLSDVLRAAKVAVRLVAPIGHKDLRDWFKAGATREAVDAAWSQAEWK